MMNRLLSLLFLLLALQTHAEQKKVMGNWDVHYIALNTTFLTPEIAKANDIVRSPNKALVNISVIDRKTQKAQQVNISGTARNLLGNTVELNFKKVVEGDAIYYLAEMPFENEDHYRFQVNLQQNKISQTLEFEQKLYRETD